MESWIKFPMILDGDEICLISLEEKHLPDLTYLANDKRIWEFYPYDLMDQNRFLKFYNNALSEIENGTRFTFVIKLKTNDKIIGSTSYLNLKPQHRQLEIGFTWLIPQYWSSTVNLESKLLLLSHCFEELHTIRVQFKTDERNVRSRKAIEKIGGDFEGILRNDMIRDDNTFRNSAYYSIIKCEWKFKKDRLKELIRIKKTPLLKKRERVEAIQL